MHRLRAVPDATSSFPNHEPTAHLQPRPMAMHAVSAASSQISAGTPDSLTTTQSCRSGSGQSPELSQTRFAGHPIAVAAIRMEKESRGQNASTTSPTRSRRRRTRGGSVDAQDPHLSRLDQLVVSPGANDASAASSHRDAVSISEAFAHLRGRAGVIDRHAQLLVRLGAIGRALADSIGRAPGRPDGDQDREGESAPERHGRSSNQAASKSISGACCARRRSRLSPSPLEGHCRARRRKAAARMAAARER